MNKNYHKDLNGIKNMLNQIKTINEAMSFGDNYDAEEYGMEPDEEAEGMADMDKMPQGEEMDEPMENPNGEAEESEAIDRIREIALKGMVKLCKMPDDPNYVALKKIFQMCDKAVTDAQNGGQPMQQQPQPQQQMRR